MDSEEHQHTTVVVGGGVIGLATAYWLSQHTQQNVIVVEARCAPVGAASGHNTGGRSSGDLGAIPDALKPFTEYCYGVFERVMEAERGLGDWCGWREGSACITSSGEEGEEGKVGWMRTRTGWGWRREPVGGKSGTLIPSRYADWLHGVCIAQEVSILTSSRVTNVTLSKLSPYSVEAVEITGPNDVLLLKECDIVFACGPWTPGVLRQLFPLSVTTVDLQPQANSGHWAVFRIPRPVDDREAGLVVSARPGGEEGQLDFVVRRDRTLWVCGLNDYGSPVPEDACTVVETSADVVQRYKQYVAEAVDFGEELELLESGRSHRPATKRKVPVVARVDGWRLVGHNEPTESTPLPPRGRVFVGAAHGAKGMMLSLGTGRLISQMVLGEAVDFDVSGLGLGV